jgi:cobyrinic acid a,c-diamide synthase
MNSTQMPRLVIGGMGSGIGKTSVMVGLTRALRARGLKVAVYKCGPDYLDPTYHLRAAGRPSHNLDSWMMGREAVLGTFTRAYADADIALIEGMMGLFDGASPVSDEGSTAQVAKWLRAPVVLVVDVSGIARTLAAIVRGVSEFDAELKLGGIFCNRLGSRGHLQLLREAVTEPVVVGGLPQEQALIFPERHLGLRTADEHAVPEAIFAALSDAVTQWCELDAIIRLAGSAPPLTPEPSIRTRTTGKRCTIGVAFDDAFHFYYEYNLASLQSLGAELVYFSPISDKYLPSVDGIYIGGGYPELHAEALANNHAMREQIAAFAAGGKPVYGECGGLMYLSAAIRTLSGQVFPMAGVIPAQTIMYDRLQALGYVHIETQKDSVLGPAGLRFRGHQFRYSELQPLGGDLDCIYRIIRSYDGYSMPEGYVVGNVLASYVHAHWASNPTLPESLIEACSRGSGHLS